MGKFALGFVVGIALGAGAALILGGKSESEGGIVATIQGNVRQVVEAAKRASTQREDELWQDYRSRVQNGK